MRSHRKRAVAGVVETSLEVEPFSDIVISENRWRSADDPRHRTLVSTESSFGSPTPSGAPSSKRCVVTTWSRAAGLRSLSGSETSWSPMPAKSSRSRLPARLYVTSAEVQRIGNDGASHRPSVAQQESDANEPTHHRVNPNLSTYPRNPSRRRFAPRGLCTLTACGKPWTASKRSKKRPVHRFPQALGKPAASCPVFHSAHKASAFLSDPQPPQPARR